MRRGAVSLLFERLSDTVTALRQFFTIYSCAKRTVRATCGSLMQCITLLHRIRKCSIVSNFNRTLFQEVRPAANPKCLGSIQAYWINSKKQACKKAIMHYLTSILLKFVSAKIDNREPRDNVIVITNKISTSEHSIKANSVFVL